MTGLELTAVIAIAVWLAALSFVVVLVTRQLGLVTVRLSLVAPHAPADEAGPEVGSAVPSEAGALIGRDGQPTVLLLLSATCDSCRSLASRLGEREVDVNTVALVAGRQPLASGIGELLPSGIDTRFDPEASQIAQRLGLEMVPFGVRIDAGIVSMKAYLHTPDDVGRLKRGGRADGTRGAGIDANKGPVGSLNDQRDEEVVRR